MKVVSTKSEIRAIVTICDGTEKQQSELLSKLEPYHFGYEPCQTIFDRIKALAKEAKEIPSTSLFVEDLALDEDAKKILRNRRIKPTKKLKTLVSNLEKYRKLRIVNEALAEVAEELQGDGPKDIDEVLDTLIDKLHRTRTKKDIHFSNNKNFKGNVERILEGELSLVPTGIRQFDQENGGLPNGQVVVLATNPGGGKSTLANQMMLNQYRLGYSPCKITMEMDEDEEWQRILSNITKIPHDKFILKELSKKQKAKVWDIAEKFRDYGKKNKKKFGKEPRFTIISPDDDLRFSELIYLVKHKPIDVLYIDYLSLLRPENAGKPTHEQLQEITRLAKRAAKQLNIPIVLLSQINKEDEIKYSGGINENAGLVWIWRYDEQAEATHEIEVVITKARNQKKFTFVLDEQFEVMRLKDADSNKKVEHEDEDEERSENKSITMSGLDEEDDL